MIEYIENQSICSNFFAKIKKGRYAYGKIKPFGTRNDIYYE